MKKTFIIVLIGLSVVGLLYLGLRGSLGANTSQSSLPTLPPVQVNAGIVAEGVIAPRQYVTLSAASSGVIQQVLVAEGDEVKSGDVLVKPDNLTELQSAVEASRQTLANAQKTYNHLIANAALTRANVQLALVQAQQDLDDAQDDTDSDLYQRASQETIDIAQARLITANQALDDAEKFFDMHNGNPKSLTYAEALSQLAKARQNQSNAQYNYDYVVDLPDPLDIEKVDAKLAVAQAKLLAAKSDWEDVKDEPDDPATVAARAQVANAQAALDAAQSMLGRAVVRAPFAGRVVDVQVKPGQLVAPGTILLTLADLSELRVETTDLTELDVAKVRLGQPATITVDGLGDQKFSAQVIQIDDQSTKYSGDVVYKVTLRLLQPDQKMRWGMSVSVHITP